MQNEPRAGRAAAFAALAAVAVLFLAATVQKVWGVDTWWQLAAGRFFAETKTFPLNDVFSYTAAQHEWIEVRWLFCVVLNTLWEAGGPGAAILLQVVLLGGVWGMLAWGVRRSLLTPAVIFAIGLGIAAGLSRWVLRPELFTYFFGAMFLVILDSPGRRGRAFVVLAMMQVAWANSHTLFAIGPVLAWMFACGENAERILLKRRGGGFDWRVCAGALAVTLACLANPYFVRGATFPILLFTQIQSGHIVSQAIGEMASPLGIPLSRWTPDLFAGVLVLVLSLGSFVLRGRNSSLPRLLVILAMAYLSMKAQRNVALLAVMGTWVTVKNLDEAMADHAWTVMRQRLAPFAAFAHAIITLGAAGLAWYIASDRMHVSVGAPRESGVGVVWWNTPREAVEFLNARTPRGPIFNAIRDGGYIAWAARDENDQPYKVFADGRLEVYGPEFLAELASLTPASWPALEQKWGFNTVVLPVHDNEALAAYLASQPRWTLVHLDHRDVIFVRDIPEHNELIRTSKVDLSKPWVPRGPEPDDAPPSGMAGAIGRVSSPYFCEGMAEVFLALNAPQQAVPYLERARANYPARERPRAVLAPIYWAMGREADADKMLVGLDEPTRLIAAKEAARLMLGAGNFTGALAPLRLAVSLEPEDRGLRVALADTAFQAGDYKTARENFAKALRSQVTLNEVNKYAYACEQLGDLAAATRAYDDSLKAAPNQPLVWNMMGGAFAKAGDKQRAEQCFREALRLKPDLEAAKKNLEALLGAR